MKENFQAVVLADQILTQEGKIAPLADYPFLQDRKIVKKIESFSLPLCSKRLEVMIQLTLGIERDLTDRDVVWAVLSSLFCKLRQNVGSCFASAPAILIHEEQPLQYLADLQELLTKGQLTRVIRGEEYTVPISPSPGLGDLRKPALEELQKEFLEKFSLKESDLFLARTLHNPKLHQIEEMEKALEEAKWAQVAETEHLLLKVWEYTIASFVDVKKEFSSWNLYTSLGLHAEEKGGIGELVYRHLEEKLEEANEKTREAHTQYEIAFDQVRATEALLRGAATEADIRRLKGEYQSRLYHLRSSEEIREHESQKAKQIAEFFPFFLESIAEKFPHFFQEIYDAEMQLESLTDYDDSPAGFRLLYKHGRAHVGSWSFIRGREAYIQALKDFFQAIELPLIDECPFEKGKEEIPFLVNQILYHLSDDSFLLSAFNRLAKAHRVPLKKLTLEELDKWEKKPWAYISGGTLPTLLKTYFRRESSLTEVARWVESPQDLLIFLLDTLKELPPNVTDRYVENPKKRMLMTSPTHVFSLLPGQPLFRKGWEDSGFTYTFVRDKIVLPAQEFYRKMVLNTEQQHHIISGFAKSLPLLEGHDLEKNTEPKNRPVSLFDLGKMIQHPDLDSFVYASLPKPKTTCVFADSNWENLLFAFVVNPLTLQFELWRMTEDRMFGAPMHEWTQYLDGSSRLPWSVFTRPQEYTS